MTKQFKPLPKNLEVHWRGKQLVRGAKDSKKICDHCFEEKHIDEYDTTVADIYGAVRTKSLCKSCASKQAKMIRQIKKDYMSIKPEACMLCGIEGEKLQVDHDHKTGAMRGWICYNCNSGLGRFKDDTQLLIKAIEYLHKDPIPKPPKQQLDLFDEME